MPMKAESMAAQDLPLKAAMEAMGLAARRAAALLAVAPAKKKSAALRMAADKIRAASDAILEANAADDLAAHRLGKIQAIR